MKKSNSDEELFRYMDFAMSYDKDFKRMVEIAEAFLKRLLNAEDIEDSDIQFPKMSARVYGYLLSSLLLDYSEDQKMSEMTEGKMSNGMFYLHVGKINSKLDFNNHQVNVYPDELEELGIDTKEGTLLIFTGDQLDKTLAQVAKSIKNSEYNGS